jgi:hypothetical protein
LRLTHLHLADAAFDPPLGLRIGVRVAGNFKGHFNRWRGINAFRCLCIAEQTRSAGAAASIAAVATAAFAVALWAALNIAFAANGTEVGLG